MSASKPRSPAPHTARTIRFPAALRESIATDAERCGRSFEQHVLAILRAHYGDDVDLASSTESVLALARLSVLGIDEDEQRRMWGRRKAGR